MFRKFILALALSLAAASAMAAMDATKFRLTPSLVDRIEAMQKESGNEGIQEDDGGEENPKTVEELAKRLDSDPRIRAVLAKYKISSLDYAASVLAMLHAGLYLATESSIEPKKRPQALASFTPEQRANIELLRGRKAK